jgi:hypothetical protein
MPLRYHMTVLFFKFFRHRTAVAMCKHNIIRQVDSFTTDSLQIGSINSISDKLEN